MSRPCRSENKFSMPRHSAAWAWHGMWISFGRPETACVRTARVRILPATVRSSTKVVIRSITIRYTAELAVRIFPATVRTFTNDTALSQNGRGAAWHDWINAARHGMGAAWLVWINKARHGKGTTWARHGLCELTRHGMAWARHGLCELTRHGMGRERRGRGRACVN
jgi:hypothetical protein